MKKQIKIIVLFLLLSKVVAFGQDSKRTAKEFFADLKDTPWIFGAGWNVVHDDAGLWYKNLFNAANAWHIPAYPSRLTCEKVLDKKLGWSTELMVAYNRYKVGNYYEEDKVLVPTQWSLLSVDLMGKYDFNKLYDLNKALFKAATFKAINEYIQPFGTFGFGYTMRTIPGREHSANFNTGLGLNSYLYGGWGLQIQSMAKFGIGKGFPFNGRNYFQHSIGVIYKFDPKLNSIGSRYKFKKHEVKSRF